MRMNQFKMAKKLSTWISLLFHISIIKRLSDIKYLATYYHALFH